MLIKQVLDAIESTPALSDEQMQRTSCVCDFLNSSLVYCELSSEPVTNKLGELELIRSMEKFDEVKASPEETETVESLLEEAKASDTTQNIGSFAETDQIALDRYRLNTVKKLAATFVCQELFPEWKSRMLPFVSQSKETIMNTLHWIEVIQQGIQAILDKQEVGVDICEVYDLIRAQYVLNKGDSLPLFALSDDDTKLAKEISQQLLEFISTASLEQKRPQGQYGDRICSYTATGTAGCRCFRFKHHISEITHLDLWKLKFCPKERMGIPCEENACYYLHMWNLKQRFQIKRGIIKFHPAKASDFIHCLIAAAHYNAVKDEQKFGECLECIVRNMILNNFMQSVWEIMF